MGGREKTHRRIIVGRVLTVAPKAEADIKDAFAWYESRSPGLGYSFLLCLEEKLELIRNSPQLFRPRFRRYRLAATRRFPYAIYFIWNETADSISIRRVLHFRQDNSKRS